MNLKNKTLKLFAALLLIVFNSVAVMAHNTDTNGPTMEGSWMATLKKGWYNIYPV